MDDPTDAFDPITRARDSFHRQAFLRLIGAGIDLLDPGRCVLSLAIRDDLTQQHGFAHAGVTTTLADTAAGYAAYTLMPADAGVLTVEFKVNLLAPATGERLIADARVVKPGRTLSVVGAEVVALAGDRRTPVATMLATMMCLPGRAETDTPGRNR